MVSIVEKFINNEGKVQNVVKFVKILQKLFKKVQKPKNVAKIVERIR